jgi:outer membrane lipoprotein LolB
LPAPSIPADKLLDNFGHVSQLKQQGWLIEYQRFTQFKGLDVPAKIRLTMGSAKVKLVISQWK